MNKIKFGKRTFGTYNEALARLCEEVIDVGPVRLVLSAFDYDRVFNKFGTFEDEVDKMISWINKALCGHGLSINSITKKAIVHGAVKNYEFIHFNKKEG